MIPAKGLANQVGERQPPMVLEERRQHLLFDGAWISISRHPCKKQIGTVGKPPGRPTTPVAGARTAPLSNVRPRSPAEVRSGCETGLANIDDTALGNPRPFEVRNREGRVSTLVGPGGAFGEEGWRFVRGPVRKIDTSDSLRNRNALEVAGRNPSLEPNLLEFGSDEQPSHGIHRVRLLRSR